LATVDSWDRKTIFPRKLKICILEKNLFKILTKSNENTWGKSKNLIIKQIVRRNKCLFTRAQLKEKNHIIVISEEFNRIVYLMYLQRSCQ
jgi:hypothetical protein